MSTLINGTKINNFINNQPRGGAFCHIQTTNDNFYYVN